MGLITKTVKIFWRNHNRKQYEDKGYEFTGLGHLFEIKIEDLFKTSRRIVECKCDKCNKEIKMKYIDYNKKSTEDGKIFCEDCEPYYIDNGNNKKFSGIYKIENLINGKVYIGQSNDVKQRWKNHKWAINQEDKGQLPLYKAFKKYGIENFSFKVINMCDEDDMNELEMFYIEVHNSFIRSENSNGYNSTLGGEGTRGYTVSDERKDYLRRVHIGIHAGGKNPAAKKVVCDGIEFGCAKDCAKYYNIKFGTMTSWLNGARKMPKEFYDKGLRYMDKLMDDYYYQTDDINKGENNVKSIPVYCEGRKFANARECAEYYNVNVYTMKNWINRINKMPKEWYERGLRQETKTMDDYEIQVEPTEKNDPNKRKVYCDDIVFNSVTECARYYNIEYHTMMGWVNKYNRLPKKFYDMNFHLDGETPDDYKVQTESNSFYYKGKKVYCEGKIFSSISECAKHYNVNRSTMQCWLNGKHTMPQEFKDKNLKYYNEEVDINE